MANYELIGLDEATPRLLAPTANDTGTIVGSLSVAKDISDARGRLQDQRNPLAKAIRVALTGSASVRGLQALDDADLDMGTNDFTVFVQKRITTTRPAANEILYHKHDGNIGVIITLLTTGIIRLTINATNFDSTAALPSATNVEPVIMTPVVRETATAAGSVTFVVDGVQLGNALAISARVEKITNGTFDSDITGWTLSGSSGGTITWQAGKMRVERTSSITSGYQAVVLAAGETLFVAATVSHVSGASADAQVVIRTGTNVSSPVRASSNSLENGASGTCRVSYYSAAGETVYVHAYVFGSNGAYDFDTITSIDTHSVDNASNLFLLGTSSTTTEGDYLDGGLYNRALSVAECLAHCVRGPALADIATGSLIPSQVPVATFSFSAGTNSFAGYGSALTGNVDGIGGKNDVLRSVASGVNSVRFLRIFSSSQVAKRGRVVVEVYRPSSNVTTTGIQIRLTPGSSSSPTIAGASVQIPADTWTTVIFDLPIQTDPSQNALAFYHCNSAGAATAGATAGDELYIASGGTLTQTGLCGHWSALDTQGDTGQVLDRSGNKNHMLLPESGAKVLGKRQALPEQVRWTNTWAGTHELQYIGGVNQNILPSKAYIESIVGVVSGSTIEDIIVGDGSDTDRYVTITTGLAAGTNTFTLANRATDGTNLKLTVDPDANFTGSITWTITYRVLD